MYKVLIVRLTNIDKSIINEIVEHLSNLGFEVDVLNEIEHLSVAFFDWERSQYNAELILNFVSKKYYNFPYDSIIAIGEFDAYAENLNYVFGLSKQKIGSVYISRLKNDFYKEKCDLNLFVERVKKEVTHELGHTLGLSHCSNKFCVMSFSNSLKDVDLKTPYFCSKCETKLNIYHKA